MGNFSKLCCSRHPCGMHFFWIFFPTDKWQNWLLRSPTQQQICLSIYQQACKWAQSEFSQMFFLKGSNNNGRLWAASIPGSFKHPSRKSPQLCHKCCGTSAKKISTKRKDRNTKQGLYEWILGQIQHLKLIPSQLDPWPLVCAGAVLMENRESDHLFYLFPVFFSQCFSDCHPLLCLIKTRWGCFEGEWDKGLFCACSADHICPLIFGAVWCFSYWNDFCK